MLRSSLAVDVILAGTTIVYFIIRHKLYIDIITKNSERKKDNAARESVNTARDRNAPIAANQAHARVTVLNDPQRKMYRQTHSGSHIRTHTLMAR